MYRYLALVWNPDSAEASRTAHLFHARTARAGWSVAWEAPGAIAFHTGARTNGAQAHPLQGNRGAVLGTLFKSGMDDRHGGQPVRFGEQETRRLVGSGGTYLIENYWGSYVAFIENEEGDGHHVFRDPIGTLPCYHHTTGTGVEIFFSHVEDCTSLGLTFSINRDYLTRWLIYSSLATRATGLQGVEDLPGGERISIACGRTARARIWDPAQIVNRGDIDDVEEAIRALRATVQHTTSAWASCFSEIVHKLSGGLDSSIVAACLAQAPTRPRVTYLNFCIDAGSRDERLSLPGVDERTAERIRAHVSSGDERYFARLVADRWQVPLIERTRAQDMDLSRLEEAPLRVAPPLMFTAMDVDDVEMECVRTHGAQAFFSGQGGDSVFFASIKAWGAMDFAFRHGIRRGFWEHLTASTALSKESLWAVLAAAVKHGVLRQPYGSGRSALDRPSHVRREVIATLTNEEFERSEYGSKPASMPPGKWHHIGGVGSSYHKFILQTGRYAEHVDPLNSQPIWELMLRIPTYTAQLGGVSRGLVRRAFSDLLPQEISTRITKGTGASLYQRVVTRNLPLLRERLLRGRLVQEGYLDPNGLRETLAAEDLFARQYAAILLSYLAAEVWLEQWAQVGTKSSAPASAALA